MPPLCSHSMFKCRPSGVVVDLSLGQFTGDMMPKVFRSVEDYRSRFPGDIVHVAVVSKQGIDHQVHRDEDAARKISPDSESIKFARRVVNAFRHFKAVLLQLSWPSLLRLKPKGLFSIQASIAAPRVKDYTG